MHSMETSIFAFEAFRGKTDTSAAAADFIDTFAGTVREKVLFVVKASGKRGVTTVEISNALNMERSTCQPRTTELRLLDLIEDSGMRRHNPNGKKAIVWVSKGVLS